jgi:hypothetical protein
MAANKANPDLRIPKVPGMTMPKVNTDVYTVPVTPKASNSIAVIVRCNCRVVLVIVSARAARVVLCLCRLRVS